MSVINFPIRFGYCPICNGKLDRIEDKIDSMVCESYTSCPACGLYSHSFLYGYEEVSINGNIVMRWSYTGDGWKEKPNAYRKILRDAQKRHINQKKKSGRGISKK